MEQAPEYKLKFEDDKARLVDGLKQAGLRLTPQRLAVCDFLNGRSDHPSVAEVHSHLKAIYPSISLTTVYATLDSLVEVGVISRMGDTGGDGVRFDVDPSPHVNLVCSSCGAIADMDTPLAQEMYQQVKSSILDLPASLGSARLLFQVRLEHPGGSESCPLVAHIHGEVSDD